MRRVLAAVVVHFAEEEWAAIIEACAVKGVTVQRTPTRIHCGAAVAALRLCLQHAGSPVRQATLRALQNVIAQLDGRGEFYLVEDVDHAYLLPTNNAIPPTVKKGDQFKYIAAAQSWGLRDIHIESSDGFVFQSRRRNDDLLIVAESDLGYLAHWLTVAVRKFTQAVAINERTYHVVKIQHGFVMNDVGTDLIRSTNGQPTADESIFSAPALDAFDLAADALDLEIMDLTEEEHGATFFVDSAPNIRVTVVPHTELMQYNATQLNVVEADWIRYGHAILLHTSGTWHGKDLTTRFDAMEKINE